MRTKFPQADRSTVTPAIAVFLLVVGLVVGGLALVPQPAFAEVATDSLTVSDGHYAAANASVTSPHVVVTGTASFDVDSPPAGWTVELQVAPTGSGDYQTIDTASGGAISAEMAFDFETVGALVDHSAFSSSDFDPPRNTTVSHDVDVRVVLTVEDADGSAIVTADATDTATVTIENTLDELSASLSGDGYWLFQDDGGDADPTPTPTGA